MKKLLLIFSIVSIIVSCQVLAQKQDTPETVFNVPLTKTSTHSGVSITLVAVVEDSRCPRDTTCIWEGKAVVKILVRASGEDATRDDGSFSKRISKRYCHHRTILFLQP